MASSASSQEAHPQALVPAWLLACYCCIVVGGGIIANVLLLLAVLRERRQHRQHRQDTLVGDCEEGAVGWWGAGGWWTLMAQLAATDALSLLLVSGGELWSVRETGGPWRLPAALCAPFMGLEAMLGAAQTYLLVALALHARAVPADPVPQVSVWAVGSSVVPSALVWMLASAVAVPRTFLAVAVSPRPALPLCSLLPTSPRTGALEGPLDAPPPGAPNPAGSWWPLTPLAVDGQGGGPLLSAIVLCAAPALILLATTLAAVSECRPRAPPPAVCPPHKLARREWVRVSTWLSLSWLLLSLPRLASAAAHGLLPAAAAPSAFRAPPLGSRALPDASLLAVSMLHYALTAGRPVLAVLCSAGLRRVLLGPTHTPPLTSRAQQEQDTESDTLC